MTSEFVHPRENFANYLDALYTVGGCTLDPDLGDAVDDMLTLFVEVANNTHRAHNADDRKNVCHRNQNQMREILCNFVDSSDFYPSKSGHRALVTLLNALEEEA